jgi:hypothetical protein
VASLALDRDGKILVGGGSEPYFVRLNPDGKLDSAFDPQADGAVFFITQDGSHCCPKQGSWTVKCPILLAI